MNLVEFHHRLMTWETRSLIAEYAQGTHRKKSHVGNHLRVRLYTLTESAQKAAPIAARHASERELYRALDALDKKSESIQTRMNTKVRASIGRNTSAKLKAARGSARRGGRRKR
jgi:hypothetical protein